MNLFPNAQIDITPPKDFSISLNKLKNSTEISSRLLTVLTNQPFIGQVTDKGFKIISSKIGIGAIAVFELDLDKNKREIKVSLNKAFKIIFAFFTAFLIIGSLVSIISAGLPQGLMFLIPLAICLLMFRFVLIGLAFKTSLNLGKNKLIEILDGINN